MILKLSLNMIDNQQLFQVGSDVFKVLFAIQVFTENAPILRIQSDQFSVSVFYQGGTFIQYSRVQYFNELFVELTLSNLRMDHFEP